MLCVSGVFFVFAALFLVVCYCTRRVVAGVDSDKEDETSQKKTTPPTDVQSTALVSLSADQLNNLVEARARELLDARLSSARVQVPSSEGTFKDVNTLAQKTEKYIETGFTSSPKYTEIAHIAFKPPQPLFNQNPIVWFEILEQQFNVANIQLETTKYSHPVGALDARLHDQFATLITRDKGNTPYTTFKQEVIRGLDLSEKTKLHNLLHGLTLGDRKPSQLLEKFRLGAGGKFNDESIRQLWMSRLPQQVQMVLSPFEKDLNLTMLAERADNLMETMSHFQLHSVASCSRTSLVPDSTSVAGQQLESSSDDRWGQFETRMMREVSALIDRKFRARSSSRSQSRDRRNRSGTREPNVVDSECFYHRRFKDRARKCIPGCKHHTIFTGDTNNQPNPKKY